MQQTDWLFWGVAFLFYLPLHAGAPLLYLLIQGEIAMLKRIKVRLLCHSLISAALAFAIAVVLWPHSVSGAVAVLLVATSLPWLGLRRPDRSIQ